MPVPIKQININRVNITCLRVMLNRDVFDFEFAIQTPLWALREFIIFEKLSGLVMMISFLPPS
ncbi:conserved hypothetical protein [delta proteobacterium NaphS2]|nr:conserved hypothetical protein [delta proteobacterium NaphS2]